MWGYLTNIGNPVKAWSEGDSQTSWTGDLKISILRTFAGSTGMPSGPEMSQPSISTGFVFWFITSAVDFHTAVDCHIELFPSVPKWHFTNVTLFWGSMNRFKNRHWRITNWTFCFRLVKGFNTRSYKHLLKQAELNETVQNLNSWYKFIHYLTNHYTTTFG